MVARRQFVLPAWAGFLLVAIGFLAFVASYFLLPFYVVNCFDSCANPTYSPTTWAFAANGLSHLSVTPVTSVILVVLCYLPLLIAVAIVGCSFGFLVYPLRTFATWSYRAWLAGSIALVILVLVVLLFVWPDIGYPGMLFGYGLLWGGNRILLAAQH